MEDQAYEEDWDYYGVKCMNGLLVPWIGTTRLSNGDRSGYGFLFLAFLIYLFVCVSFISEAMMSRFRKVTSSWNKTVANFTLLSFGITAPQMFMVFVETLHINFYYGDIRSSTIIGSAAFRVLFIFGYLQCVCPFVAFNGKVGNLFVFLVSSVISLGSFIWLFLIVFVISKGEIEIFEALLTMVTYPFVVLILFALDIQVKKKVSNSANVAIGLQEGQFGTHTGDTNDGAGNTTAQCDGTENIEEAFHPGANNEEQHIPSKTVIDSNKTDKACKVCRLILMPWLLLFDLLSKLPAATDLVLSVIFAYFILMPIHIVLIQDIAQHLGCSILLKEVPSGIFLMTLGFCIPSLISADRVINSGETVDNIISQMIGSNIMSVFLGLGLPWLILSSYHAIMGTDEGYQFPHGSFGFNVLQVFGCVLIATSILLIGSLVPNNGHRKLQDNKTWRTVCGIIFALFWLIFVLFSFLESYGFVCGIC